MNSDTGIVMSAEMIRALLEKGAEASARYVSKFDTEVDPESLTVRNRRELHSSGATHVSRNAKCPCGSKKRFRKCHGRKA